ncbi:MAG: hypothetical protein HY811_09245 [Planctomycetes bacterium]|nr:hypothetical protein [Planctomycetota bacterium]
MAVKTTCLLLLLGTICLFSYSAFAEDDFKPSMKFTNSRFSAGYIDSERNGSYSAGSYYMPDARLEFNWLMSPDATVHVRMNLNNAKFTGMCCFYVELRNLAANISPSLKDSAFNPSICLGQFKMDFGEENFSNDPTNGVLISNSAANIAGMDEGLNINQVLPKETLGFPARWSLSFHNGNTTAAGGDNTQSKAVILKLSALPLTALYVSGSYYNSGDLGVQDAALGCGGLVTRPTNATEWTRNIWEVDLRYDIEPGSQSDHKQSRSSCCAEINSSGILPGPPAFSDSKAFVRLAYGKFTDDGKDRLAPVLKVTEREGSYYYLEGCYNATKKVYLGARYSFIGFDKSDMFASLNGVNANDYTRISAGPGYRLSKNTHIKAEYSVDSEKMPTGVSEPKNNQIAILFTTLFD